MPKPTSTLRANQPAKWIIEHQRQISSNGIPQQSPRKQVRPEKPAKQRAQRRRGKKTKWIKEART